MDFTFAHCFRIVLACLHILDGKASASMASRQVRLIVVGRLGVWYMPSHPTRPRALRHTRLPTYLPDKPRSGAGSVTGWSCCATMIVGNWRFDFNHGFLPSGQHAVSGSYKNYQSANLFAAVIVEQLHQIMPNMECETDRAGCVCQRNTSVS